MMYQTRKWGAALILGLLSVVAGAAETGSLKGVLSWSGHGRVFQIGVDEQEFMGVLEGVLYIETSEGALDEAFMECTVKQLLHAGDNQTRAHGNCVIIQSGADNVFAEYRCEGAIGACRGTFNLTGGTGRFEGIKGGSDLIIRSPMRHLARSLTDTEDLVVDNGVALFPELRYRLKGGAQ